jgi:mycothiol synthase
VCSGQARVLDLLGVLGCAASNIRMRLVSRSAKMAAMFPANSRPAAEGDEPAILAMLRAAEAAEAGAPMSSGADVSHLFAAPGLGLATRSRIMLDGDWADGLVLLHPAPQPGELRAHLIVSPAGAAGTAELLGLIDDWADADRPDGARVEVTMFELPGFLGRDALIAAGWSVVRRYTQLSGDLDRVEPPRLEDRTAVRAAASQADLAVIHGVIEDAVAGHWKHSRRDFAAFRASQQERDGYDPALWFLAQVDGEPAGAVIARAPPGRAWIAWLGVLPRHRGRGLAGALLRACFFELRQRGHRRAGVDVDSANESEAVAVYEKLGMEIVGEAEQWSKSYG